MRLTIYISFLFFVLTTSCKKDHLIGDKKILVGTWKWQSSTVMDYCSGYFQSIDHTPETINVNYKIVFLKRGIIEFYRNSSLLNSHKIYFQKLDIQKDGIVESHKEISFIIYLDGDSEQKFYGEGTPNKFRINDFPYSDDEECSVYALNYFRKE